MRVVVYGRDGHKEERRLQPLLSFGPTNDPAQFFQQVPNPVWSVSVLL